MEILELLFAFIGMLGVGIFLAIYAFYLFFTKDFDELDEFMERSKSSSKKNIYSNSKSRLVGQNR